MKLNFLPYCFVLMLFAACKQIDVFEYNKVIPKNEWHRNAPIKGEFTITDTSSVFNIYIVLRHTDAYQYNNIWLNIGIQAPGDTMSFQNVNLSLASDDQGWEGVGLNDIWEVRKLISGIPRRFIKPGKYHFEIRQIMRHDPLLHVLNAGLRVERMY